MNTCPHCQSKAVRAVCLECERTLSDTRLQTVDGFSNFPTAQWLLTFEQITASIAEFDIDNYCEQAIGNALLPTPIKSMSEADALATVNRLRRQAVAAICQDVCNTFATLVTTGLVNKPMPHPSPSVNLIVSTIVSMTHWSLEMVHWEEVADAILARQYGDYSAPQDTQLDG